MPSSGSRIALDTSAYAHFRHQHAGVLDRIGVAAEVVLSTVVIGELLGGFSSGSRRKENETTLDAFLEEDFVRVADITREVAQHYGQLYSTLRARGTPIPTNDMWIAATALSTGAELLTFDSDFERVPGLRCTLFTAAAVRR